MTKLKSIIIDKTILHIDSQNVLLMTPESTDCTI